MEHDWTTMGQGMLSPLFLVIAGLLAIVSLLARTGILVISGLLGKSSYTDHRGIVCGTDIVMKNDQFAFYILITSNDPQLYLRFSIIT